MNNPCNEICIGKVDDVVEWWQVNSYNAGYHRGLNTEYHDIPINILFTKWIADVRRPASAEAFDIVAFEKGYNDGKDDYLCGGNTPERVEEQIEWLKKLAKKENEQR